MRAVRTPSHTITPAAFLPSSVRANPKSILSVIVIEVPAPLGGHIESAKPIEISHGLDALEVLPRTLQPSHGTSSLKGRPAIPLCRCGSPTLPFTCDGPSDRRE